jgi:hypothetical protein
LKGVALPADAAVWEHNPHDGSCHLLPTKGVVLVVTDEHGCETAFGFFQYAEAVKDIHGRTLAETGLAGRWHFSEFVDSPDPWFREIVALFAAGGFAAARRTNTATSSSGRCDDRIGKEPLATPLAMGGKEEAELPSAPPAHRATSPNATTVQHREANSRYAHTRSTLSPLRRAVRDGWASEMRARVENIKTAIGWVEEKEA